MLNLNFNSALLLASDDLNGLLNLHTSTTSTASSSYNWRSRSADEVDFACRMFGERLTDGMG